MGRTDKRPRAEPSSGKADMSDAHIAALIGELENLLVERRTVEQGSAAQDPHAMAAAPFAQPYLANAVAASPMGFPAGRARLARELIRQRRLRSEYLPASLFAEPAWDMLLDLYAAHYEEKPVAVSSLCIAANVPSSTALRSIEAMTREGCIVRSRDPGDGRRIFITLSDTARVGMDAYFDALAA